MKSHFKYWMALLAMLVGCESPTGEARLLKAQEAPATYVEQAVDRASVTGSATVRPHGALARVDLQSTPLPVLVPGAALGWAPRRARLTPIPGGHTLALHGEDLHIVVRGTGRAVARPDLAGELEGAVEPVRVSHAHALWSAAFRRFGVSWLLTVECAEPHGDARCADDAFIRSVVKQLEVMEAAP